MLRIFTSVKIQRLRLGLNPQTWVPEASMLTTRPPKQSNLCSKCNHVSNSCNVCREGVTDRSQNAEHWDLGVSCTGVHAVWIK